MKLKSKAMDWGTPILGTLRMDISKVAIEPVNDFAGDLRNSTGKVFGGASEVQPQVFPMSTNTC